MRMVALSILLCIASILCTSTCSAEPEPEPEPHTPWSFIVLADPHNAETFAARDATHRFYQRQYSANLRVLKHIKQTHGGEFVMIPGDTNQGKWFASSFAKKLGDPSLTPKEAVGIASRGCYGTLRKIFQEVGYDEYHAPMVAIGDHELGGNGWGVGSDKVAVLQDYRDGFQKELNRKENGEFLYSEPIGIGNAPSRPLGTIYENTSYARTYKNVLFVTIDCFHSKGSGFMDREEGLGGEGSVTVSVEDEHLTWLEEVLKEAQKDDMIRHIIVQAHVPVLQPVRKVNSSGQFFDRGSDSPFWKLMVKYGVDLYFAGEVHTTTATKDSDSNLLQIASRGNKFNNFLSVEIIGNDSIRIKAFNEVGTIKMGENNTYTQFGEISVNKANGNGNGNGNGLDATTIESDGVLELLDVEDGPLIRFDFEKIVSMATHQVLGLKNGDEINVRGITCTESMKNEGIFGQQYNAQIANIGMVQGRRDMTAGAFTSASRFAIYSRSPHGAGNMISYNVWIKTTQDGEMVLVHFGKAFGKLFADVNSSESKDMHMLTLDNGNPTLYIGPNAKVVPSQPLELHDDAWHHVSVSMPERSCLLSAVIMYVDGNPVSARIPQGGQDRHIFHFTSGSLSLGGFGYSSNYEVVFPSVQPYTGLMDDFVLFGRPVTSTELGSMTAPNFVTSSDTSCDDTTPVRRTKTISQGKCKKLCKKRKWCKGYEFSQVSGAKKCSLYDQIPEIGESTLGTKCVVKVT